MAKHTGASGVATSPRAATRIAVGIPRAFHVSAGTPRAFPGLYVELLAAVLLLLLLPDVIAKHHVFDKPVKSTDYPKFSAAIANTSAPLGREATMTCVVDDLGNYKVAWLRVDTQTILTIANNVITKSHRVGVSHSDQRTWLLHIKEARESDRGWYMCQLNTDPMKSQLGYLDIVVPPDILDDGTSADQKVRENSNATLQCSATGSPPANITWRRENGKPIFRNVDTVEGPVLSIPHVKRDQMGAYLCIASNGVPPSVSKRIMLTVEFPPVIKPESQMVGARLGYPQLLECWSHAFPRAVNFWVKKDEVIARGMKYETYFNESGYSTHMQLIIKSMTKDDFGEYKCASRNILGETEASIILSPARSQDTGGWNVIVTRIPPKHSKGKHQQQHSRPLSDNSVEVPDAEESTASSSAACRQAVAALVVWGAQLLRLQHAAL